MIKALIVDDTPDKYIAISEALKKHNFNITIVENISDAKKELASTCFDLAIIDLALPIWKGDEIKKSSGIELIREISEMPWYFFPKSVLAITQHEEYLSNKDALNELGVILYKYEPDKDIQEQLKPYIQKSINNNEKTSFDYDI
ncbi:response regulator, partial [Erwinia persicina]